MKLLVTAYNPLNRRLKWYLKTFASIQVNLSETVTVACSFVCLPTLCDPLEATHSEPKIYPVLLGISKSIHMCFRTAVALTVTV